MLSYETAQFICFVLTGLSRAIHNKANPNQESFFICYIEGILPADENDINLYRLVDGPGYEVTGISRGETTSDGDEHAVSFIVQSVVQGEVYVCSLQNGSVIKFIPINATIYGMFVQFFHPNGKCTQSTNFRIRDEDGKKKSLSNCF